MKIDDASAFEDVDAFGERGGECFCFGVVSFCVCECCVGVFCFVLIDVV